MIVRDIVLNVSDTECKLSNNVVIYNNDRNIMLRIKLQSFPYTFRKSPELLQSVLALGSGVAKAVILKPNGEKVLTDCGVFQDDIIEFVINKEMADELTEVGEHTIQIRLYDEERTGRISLHPFCIQVKNELASLDD